jgi:hypothetical protein
MPVATADVGVRAAARPPVRIRTLLLIFIVGGGLWWLYPRAIAAWKLHSEATALADYGLCMVGPTGPSLLRDDPAEFRRLVRRRLVSSNAGDRPFARCADAARELTGSSRVEGAHLATAWTFVEYGGAAADRAAQGSATELTLADLRVTTRPLAELANGAWPFSRSGYTELVRPSIGAYEAIHPIELPRPRVGRGLPAWRARYRSVVAVPHGFLLAVGQGANLSAYTTRDGGVSWTPASVRRSEIAQVEGRCAPSSGGHAFMFGLSQDGRFTTVVSLGSDAAPESQALAPVRMQVFAASCDDSALVAALKPKGSREVTFALCAFRGACSPLNVPAFSGVGVRPRFPLDVARVDGATIVAVAMHGVVRVTSSRDDGQSWTPYNVAFDASAHPDVHTSAKVPDRLLVLGHRVLLYGGAPEPQSTYPVLLSDDDGAAWRTP